MTSNLHISGGDAETLRFVAQAVQHEIERLEMVLAAANRWLEQLESTYNVSSDVFYESMAAEDLPGDNKDEQYILWAGEIELRDRLRVRLEHLQRIKLNMSISVSSSSRIPQPTDVSSKINLIYATTKLDSFPTST
jgi:hypothetical protein